MRGALLLAFFVMLLAGGLLLLAPWEAQGAGSGQTQTSTTTTTRPPPDACDWYREIITIPEDPDPPGRNDYNGKLKAVLIGDCDIVDVVAVYDYEPSVPHSATQSNAWFRWYINGTLVAEGPVDYWDFPDSYYSNKTVEVVVEVYPGKP